VPCSPEKYAETSLSFQEASQSGFKSGRRNQLSLLYIAPLKKSIGEVSSVEYRVSKETFYAAEANVTAGERRFHLAGVLMFISNHFSRG
jgi:hypothetical protein